jgi:quercetin dioxygenase-like cupin family protein
MTKFISIAVLSLTLSGPVWAQEAGGVKAEVLAKSNASWDGTALPDYGSGAPEVTILKLTVPPKTRMPMHEHPTISAGVLLSGELTVETKDHKTRHLTAGDALVEVVNQWHAGRNDGDVPAEIIVFYAGHRGSPNTIAEKTK